LILLLAGVSSLAGLLRGCVRVEALPVLALIAGFAVVIAALFRFGGIAAVWGKASRAPCCQVFVLARINDKRLSMSARMMLKDEDAGIIWFLKICCFVFVVEPFQVARC